MKKATWVYYKQNVCPFINYIHPLITFIILYAQSTGAVDIPTRFLDLDAFDGAIG